jgi:hypothetical protein
MDYRENDTIHPLKGMSPIQALVGLAQIRTENKQAAVHLILRLQNANSDLRRHNIDPSSTSEDNIGP